MIKRGPFPPTIFNMVVDTVARQLVSMVAGGVVDQDGWGREVLHHTVLLYADDGLVTSTEHDWLQ